MKNKFKTLFVTGIGTDVGKTIVSAILTEALEADYWKPIQSGDLDGETDLMKVKSLISNSKTNFNDSIYQFKTPVSPHLAASIENVKIKTTNLKLKEVNNHLLIEGAGGLLVPINNKKTIVDLIKKEYYVVLVSKNYLGSINHTLLSINLLQRLGFNKIGIIFNGTENIDSEKIIKKLGKIKIIGRINQLDNLNKVTIKKSASEIKPLIAKFLKNN